MFLKVGKLGTRVNLATASRVEIQEDLILFWWATGGTFAPDQDDDQIFIDYDGVLQDGDLQVCIYPAHPGYQKITDWIESNTI